MPHPSPTLLIRPGHRPAAAARCDRGSLWSEIERLAVETAAREPFLRRMLDEMALSRETPARNVGAVLSRRLAPGRGQDARLQALVVETLGEDHAVLELVEADLLAVTARDPACRSTALAPAVCALESMRAVKR
jgi:hypothetical protein